MHTHIVITQMHFCVTGDYRLNKSHRVGIAQNERINSIYRIHMQILFVKLSIKLLVPEI